MTPRAPERSEGGDARSVGGGAPTHCKEDDRDLTQSREDREEAQIEGLRAKRERRSAGGGAPAHCKEDDTALEPRAFRLHRKSYCPPKFTGPGSLPGAAPDGVGAGTADGARGGA